MDAAAEIGMNPVSTRFSLSMEMSRLTRDGTAETVSRDQILRGANGDREILVFPVQLTTSRIGNLALSRLILTLALCYHHAYEVVVMSSTRTCTPKLFSW